MPHILELPNEPTTLEQKPRVQILPSPSPFDNGDTTDDGLDKALRQELESLSAGMDHLATIDNDDVKRVAYAKKIKQFLDRLPEPESQTPLPPSLTNFLSRLVSSTITFLATETHEQLVDLYFDILSLTTALDVTGRIWTTAVEGILENFELPVVLGESGKDDDATVKKTRRQFQRKAERIMMFVLGALDNMPEDTKALTDNVTYHCLVLCATFLGDETNRWSTANLKKQAEEILTHLLLHTNHTRTKPFRRSQLVARHAERILQENVKPYFMHQPPPLAMQKESARGGFGKGVREQWEADLGGDAQPWKVERVECVPVLVWVVMQLEHGQCGPLQPSLFPPLLTLLDDYQPTYKLVGARLTTHVLITCSAPVDVRRTNLGDVFFNSLLHCLTYHSEVELLEVALPAIVNLVPVIDQNGSQAFVEKLERVMQDGVLRGLSFAVGGSVAVIRTLVSSIPTLTRLLQLGTIRFLHPLLGIACEILQLHILDPQTQLRAAEAVVEIVKECWPRISKYRGVILKAVATAWRGIPAVVANKNSSEETLATTTTLKHHLKSICVLLRECCGEEIEPDFQLLLKVDRELYSELLDVQP
ncbi:hypothetical protein DFJ77DRAFT_452749 [Powellomyces hirtus]|nr:hypothetical protein DFJ77DRAFT_452749 [Powellomyces hirtus]